MARRLPGTSSGTLGGGTDTSGTIIREVRQAITSSLGGTAEIAPNIPGAIRNRDRRCRWGSVACSNTLLVSARIVFRSIGQLLLLARCDDGLQFSAAVEALQYGVRRFKSTERRLVAARTFTVP